MKKFLCMVCVVAMLACVCLATASCGKKEAEKEMVIGFSGPLSGGAAVYGQAVKDAAEMAVAEINAAGGIAGYKVVLKSYDDKHNDAEVSTTYAAMLADGVVLSLGTVTTKPGLQFKELSKAENLFFMTPSASGYDIPTESNGYQMCFADPNQGTAAAQSYVIPNCKGESVGALVNASDEYSTGIEATFEAAINAYNATAADDQKITIVKQTFTEGASDFSQQAAALKNCRVIFTPIYYTPISQLMLEMNKINDNTVEVYYGADGMDGIDSMEGFDISVVPQEVSMLSHYDPNSTAKAVTTFKAAFNAKYGHDPIQFGAAAYDVIYLLKAACEAAGADAVDTAMNSSDPVDSMCKLVKGVIDSESFTFSGVTGTNMTWNNGYVSKNAQAVIVKQADAE